MSDDLQPQADIARRLETLIQRLRTTYGSIGGTSGRPYVYFVYPPAQELAVRRLVDENLRDDDVLHYEHIDLLPLTIETLEGQEERRQALLEDPVKSTGAAQSILRKWARALEGEIQTRLADQNWDGRPIVVLHGLAALHPLGDPTSFMETVAHHEPRDPTTGKMIPIVLLVPGTREAQASRTYNFLGLEDKRLEFYRGEGA